MALGSTLFVALPPATDGSVIFAKNSDRPEAEIQELVYFPPREASSAKLKVTHIEVDDAGAKAVILSKPGWLWGAEMGANAAGVACGNAPVQSRLAATSGADALTGMDLVRLCLERAGSAEEGVEVIGRLVEAHGQGGPCSKDGSLAHDNSFIVADRREAWIIDSAGRQWAARKITDGFRNISNCYTITTQIDKMSEGLKTYAVDNQLWNGEGELDFAAAFGASSECTRDSKGKELIEAEISAGPLRAMKVFQILRDQSSGICVSSGSDLHTASSQVSVLHPEKLCFHWFTATPDPSVSVYKPFVFTPNSKISQHTACPKDTEDQRHGLYRAWEMGHVRQEVREKLRSTEAECVDEVEQFTGTADLSELDDLLKDIVETEIKFYK